MIRCSENNVGNLSIPDTHLTRQRRNITRISENMNQFFQAQPIPISTNVLQVLTVTNGGDKKTSNINVLLPEGNAFTRYTFHRQKSDSKYELRYANTANPGGHPVGTVKFHTMSSKIDITLHGVAFTMAKKDPFGGGHHLSEMSLGGEIQWKESSFMGSGVQLLDAQKRVIARYSTKLKQGPPQKRFGSLLGGGSTCAGLEIFVPAQDWILDLIVLTGLAAAEYRRQSNEDWGVVGKKVGKEGGSGEVEEIVASIFGG